MFLLLFVVFLIVEGCGERTCSLSDVSRRIGKENDVLYHQVVTTLQKIREQLRNDILCWPLSSVSLFVSLSLSHRAALGYSARPNINLKKIPHQSLLGSRKAVITFSKSFLRIWGQLVLLGCARFGNVVSTRTVLQSPACLTRQLRAGRESRCESPTAVP